MTVKWCISVLGMFNYTLLCSTGPRASTDRPCPSHSRDTDTLHVPTPRRHATLMWTVQCVVVIATSLRMPTTGKRKAETRAQRTARLERKTREPLHTCASLPVSPCILGFHVRQFFSPVTSHKPFFTLSYTSTTRAHCILDTYAHVMHTGVHRPHPLA